MAYEKVKVAILDDYQDIASGKFSHLGDQIEVVSFPDTIPDANFEALISRLKPFAVISTMRERTRFPAKIIESLPNLKLLLTTGMKNAAIDLNACSKQGVIVAGAKGAGRPGSHHAQSPSTTSLDSTMQHTWALILGLARNLPRDDFNIKHQNGWETSFATGLNGKTLSVLGLGKLGADTARVGLLAFGMKIVAWSANLTQKEADAKAESLGLPLGSFQVAESKDYLFKVADVLSIHYVLSERSEGIVGPRELSLLKSSAMIVNTSRAGLVQEQALLDCLNGGRVKGAALDVFSAEPLPAESVWRTTNWGKDGRSEVVLSPHMGYVEEGVMLRWYDETVSNLETWLAGKDIASRLN